MKAGEIVTQDFTKQFEEVIARFKKDAVLIGIPADSSARTNSKGPITNAALLAIAEFGSPINNIPARPVLTNGIRNCQDEIANLFKECGKKALTKGPSAIKEYYEKAGITASVSVKKAINDQDFRGGGPNNEKPADSTMRARRARGFKGTKSLIVTGQLRNSITYVVRSDI